MDSFFRWTQWLSSPDCRAALEGTARFIYREALRISMPSDLLPCPDPWKLPPEERADCLQALADDLWVFLRSRSEDWYRKMGMTPEAGRGTRFVMLRVAQQFLNELKDKARTLAYDPRRALYRRLRLILREAAEVSYRSTGRGAFYSMVPEAEPSPSLEALRMEPYDQWDSPIMTVGLKGLEKRSSLLTLAKLFWDEACRRLGRPCYLPVRELAGFIVAHYPEANAAVRVSLDLCDEDVSGSSRVGTDNAADGGSVEVSYVGMRLEELARQMAGAWSDTQRSTFLLVQGEGLTLAEAARRLGYQSAAGVSYVYRSALDKLRDFCLLWPGLSPPDLDERLFEAFILALVRVCKTTG